MSGTQSGKQSSDPVIAVGAEIALDRLRRLLQRQLELVHQGSLAAAVELFDQTDRCVREIAVARGLGTAGGTDPASVSLSESWLRLERLYQDLSLALAAQRTEVSAALNAIRQGKKVLKTYGSHLSFT